MPPHGEEVALAAGRVEVERARRVAGDAFFMKGHMALDCRRTASMLAASIGVSGACSDRRGVVRVVRLGVLVESRFSVGVRRGQDKGKVAWE